MKKMIFSIAIVLVSIGLTTTPAMARTGRGGAMSHRPSIVEARGPHHGPRVEKRMAVRPMVPVGGRHIAHPIGMRFNARPAGVVLSFGGVNFIYNNGIFYSAIDRGFEVIRPRVGMIVPSLPVGHSVMMRNGARYYVHNGVIYSPMHRGGTRVFRVAGFI
jgi:hypothetical protein